MARVLILIAFALLVVAPTAAAQADSPDGGGPCPPINLNGDIDADCINGYCSSPDPCPPVVECINTLDCVTATLAAPTDLEGFYDDATGQLRLTWLPPDDAPYTFHVYRDHEEIGQTMSTSFTDPDPVDAITGLGDFVYTVRAQPPDTTMQGAPSEPFLFHNHPQAETAVDDSVELVQEMFIVGPINHYGIELNGREWCEPVHAGVGVPQVDEGCLWSLLQP